MSFKGDFSRRVTKPMNRRGNGSIWPGIEAHCIYHADGAFTKALGVCRWYRDQWVAIGPATPH